MELYAFAGRAPESISKDEFQKYDGSLIITNGKTYHQVIRNKRSEAFFIAHYETMMKMDGYLYLQCVSNIIINLLACAIQNGSFDIEYLQRVSAEDIKDLVSYLHMYMIPLSFDKYTAEIRDLAPKLADDLEKAADEIIAANRIDLQAGQEMGLTSALLERLTLDKGRIAGMAEGLREISLLPDPIGEVLEINRRPNGLEVGRVRTPIGVIRII